MNERINTVSKRYGQALIDTLKTKEEYHKITEDLTNFLTVLNSNSDFKSGMHSFLFSDRQKDILIDSISEKLKLDRKSCQFLKTLSEKNRIQYLKDIIYISEILWLKKTNVEKIKVISSKKLSSELLKKLKVELKKAVKKEVLIDNEIDPALIAGIKLQRGGQFFDFSIKGNLKRLKDSIMEEGV